MGTWRRWASRLFRPNLFEYRVSAPPDGGGVVIEPLLIPNVKCRPAVFSLNRP